MDRKLFNQLVQSLREAKQIADGKAPPSRRFDVAVKPKQNRSKHG